MTGFLIYGLDGTAAIVGLVAGVGSGSALYTMVALGIRDALRGPTSAEA